MKRTLLIAIAAVLLCATGAMAGVQNTPHDMVNTWGAGARQGICSYCHVPHSAQGARLWPSTPDPTISANYGIVGALCYSCHAAVALGTATANNVTDTVFNSAAGIYNHHLANPATAAYPNTSTAAVFGATPSWPWTNSAVGSMECTSCHNVHTQTAASAVAGYATARNFLRSPYYEGTAAAPTGMFCDKCHGNRLDAASSNALGTHPVGGVVAPGDTARGGVHTPHVAGNVTYPMSAGNIIALYAEEGGHTTDGTAAGGTACWTCHQPHGADEKLIYQTRYDATGFSAICESCHGQRPSLSEAADTLLFHPVDNNPTNTGDDVVPRGAGTITITVARPFLNNLGDSTSTYASVLNAYAGTGGQVVCLSCHGVHEAQVGTQIFRQEKISPGTGICDDCHQTVMAGSSHPVNVTMTNEYGGVWPNNGALPLYAGNLRCETCHAGHSGAVGARFLLRRTDANSEICVDCHTPTNTTSQAIFPATNGATTVSNSANPSAYIQETLYAGTTVGAVGARLGTHAAYRTVRATGGHDAWKVTLTGEVAGMTNFYGANGNTVICQSCHTPHGADTVGGWHGTAGSKNILFVQNGTLAVRTGADGGGNVGGGQQTGYDETQDSICQGCHVPTGTHAVQAWTVSRTAAALNTASTFVLSPITSPADYSGSGAMTCESCHAPHAAVTAAGSFILEAGASATAPTGGERPDDRNRDALCALCHNY